MNSTRVSLVINTYNRMHTLPTTLRSLESLRYPELEIIVVDGPSADGTSSYLRSTWDGKLKILSCDAANLGKSRNVGIRNASGDIICFIDDDGIPEPDWLNNLVQAYADPSVGAAGGWVRNHTGVDFQTKYIVSSRDSTSEVLIEDEGLLPECAPFADKFPGLIGVNSSFRRSALLEVGGFDEAYAYHLDKTDVLVRMVDAGYLIRMVPAAEVHHKYASSHIRTHSGISKSWRQIVTSAAYYTVKNAAPGTGLSACMEIIGSFKGSLKNHTDWYLSQKMIDEVQHSRLLAEIEQGYMEGITDAFKYPNRRLIGSHEISAWKKFVRPLPFEQRLRLAFVTALYPPRPGGGVAVFINNLAKRLADLGHEITVVTQGEPGRPHTVDFEDGVWVHRLPDVDADIQPDHPDDMPDMPNGPKAIAARILAELDRVNERRAFQYVIGTIWDMDLAAAIASGRYLTAMYLVTSYKLIEDSKPEWKENVQFYEGHVKKMIAAETWALGRVDHVFASTNAIRRDIEEAYGVRLDTTRLSILPFGVPEPSESIPVVCNKGGTVNMLFVGRFERRKGIDLLMACLPSLLSRHQNLRVVCIGDNAEAAPGSDSYLARFSKEHAASDWFSRVEFPGHVGAFELEQAYAECDIFVAPSRYESFGLIYVEAMRFGKACIGPDIGGVPEVIADQETGLLIPPGDAGALEHAIERVIVDTALRERLGSNGRERYLRSFTTERFALAFADEIRSSMNATSRRVDGELLQP